MVQWHCRQQEKGYDGDSPLFYGLKNSARKFGTVPIGSTWLVGHRRRGLFQNNGCRDCPKASRDGPRAEERPFFEPVVENIN
jgi:hypothetical protein